MKRFPEECTDEKLYEKYGLRDEEIEYVDSMIKPMELCRDCGDRVRL